MRVRFASAMHNVMYLPLYRALDRGYLADEGLDVDIVRLGDTGIADAFAHDRVDVALGGLWRPVMYRGRGPDLRAFAVVCARIPQMLVGREPHDSFEWQQLAGRTVVLPAYPCSSWMSFSSTLVRHGVDPTGVRFVRDIAESEAMALWDAGMGEYILAMTPSDQALLSRGSHSVADLAEWGGPVPWSTLYSTPRTLRRIDGLAEKFGRALTRSVNDLRTTTAADAASLLCREFPDLEPRIIAASVERLQRVGMWPRDAAPQPREVEPWLSVIWNHGLIDRPMDYAEIVP
ncbi:ABC transporter substrate-binding protein [Rhodococcus sp. NPDC055024]